MACFTTEHVLPIVPHCKTCKVGDIIWIIEYDDSTSMEMWKFDTKTKKCEKVHLSLESRQLFDTQTLSLCNIFSANGKLYLSRFPSEDSSRLFEFDPLTLEWKRLRNVGVNCYTKSIIMHNNELYVTNGYMDMRICNMDTNQVKIVKLPQSWIHSDHDDGDICELNGKIYLVCVRRPYWRSLYQYDNDGDKFVDIKKKDRMSWAIEQYGNHLPEIYTYVWTGHNKIYQAISIILKSGAKDYTENLVIDCFELRTEKWHTVFQSKFRNCVPNVVGDGDNNVYLIFYNPMNVIVREIDLDPNLENISLIQLADTSVANYHTENYVPLTNKLPYGLRYDNMITWKLHDTPLGRLEHLMDGIEQMESMKAESRAIWTHLDIEFKALSEEQQKDENVEYRRVRRELLDFNWRINGFQRREAEVFRKLRLEYLKHKRLTEYQYGKLEELRVRFRDFEKI